MPQAQSGSQLIVAEQIPDGLITSAMIALDTIAAVDIAANAVGDSEIAAHTTTKITLPLANLANAGGAQGDIMYWSGSAWTRLAPGTSGNYLKTQGASANPAWASPPGKIAASGAQTTTGDGTTNELTILQVSIPANTLGTTGVVHLYLPISLLRGDSGGATSTLIRYKYGATTLFTHTLNLSTFGGGLDGGHIEVFLFADGATNAQRAWIVLRAQQAGDIATATIGPHAWAASLGTAAEDSTQAKNLTLTIQWNAGGTNNKIINEGYIILSY